MESAILVSTLLKKKDYFSLMQKSAEISNQHEDVDRSIAAYTEIYRKYLQEKKGNEVLASITFLFIPVKTAFVSHILSNLLLCRGDFVKAQGTLEEALSLMIGLSYLVNVEKFNNIRRSKTVSLFWY